VGSLSTEQVPLWAPLLRSSRSEIGYLTQLCSPRWLRSTSTALGRRPGHDRLCDHRDLWSTTVEEPKNDLSRLTSTIFEARNRGSGSRMRISGFKGGIGVESEHVAHSQSAGRVEVVRSDPYRLLSLLLREKFILTD